MSGKWFVNLVERDLLKLPKDVMTYSSGLGGEYYRVDYDLGVTFSAGGIEFRFLHEGKVMGFVDADYYQSLDLFALSKPWQAYREQRAWVSFGTKNSFFLPQLAGHLQE